MTARARSAAEKRRADADVQRAVETILRRGGDPAAVKLLIHEAYEGRYELRPLHLAGARCPTHPDTAPLGGGICPICGPKENP